MARDADSLKVTTGPKWASTGDVATPESQNIDRAEGWGARFSSDSGPPREVVNQTGMLGREGSGALIELAHAGAFLEWDAAQDYEAGAVVRGSDGLPYRAVIAAGPAAGEIINPVGRVNDRVWQAFARDAPGEASAEEVEARAIGTKYVSPRRLPAIPAEASATEVDAGTNASKYISPRRLEDRLSSFFQ